MSFEFKDSTEAIIGIATVMMAADKVGTLTEKTTLLNELKKLDMFDGTESAQLNRILGEVTDKIYETLPCDDGCLTSASFESLLQAAKKVLSVDLRAQAFQVSVALAGADGLADAETSLLNQIEKGLGIDPQFSKRILRKKAA